jgi:cytochrome c-type biogenesis protein CcmH
VKRRVVLAFAFLIAAGAAAGAADAPAADASRVVGPPHGGPLQGPELDRRLEEVGALLRCPVCQGLSVTDSPSGMARNMRDEVRFLLAAGYDGEQVLSYFEHSYGEFVRLKPPLRGLNWVVWFAPLFGLLVGGGMVVRVLRAPRAPAGAAEPGLPRT